MPGQNQHRASGALFGGQQLEPTDAHALANLLSRERRQFDELDRNLSEPPVAAVEYRFDPLWREVRKTAAQIRTRNTDAMAYNVAHQQHHDVRECIQQTER